VPLASLPRAPPSSAEVVPASLVALGITQPEREDTLEMNRPLNDKTLAESQRIFMDRPFHRSDGAGQLFSHVFFETGRTKCEPADELSHTGGVARGIL
jgi:hypothetical protein